MHFSTSLFTSYQIIYVEVSNDRVRRSMSNVTLLVTFDMLWASSDDTLSALCLFHVPWKCMPADFSENIGNPDPSNASYFVQCHVGALKNSW